MWLKINTVTVCFGRVAIFFSYESLPAFGYKVFHKKLALGHFKIMPKEACWIFSFISKEKQNDNSTLNQFSRSVTFWYGSGYLWLTDPAPDPSLFVSDFQDANKNNFFPNLFSYLLFKGTFTSFFKDKKSYWIFLFFCLLMEGSGSSMIRNIRIKWIQIGLRIRNTA
jgi:hypothetical protein